MGVSRQTKAFYVPLSHRLLVLIVGVLFRDSQHNASVILIEIWFMLELLALTGGKGVYEDFEDLNWTWLTVDEAVGGLTKVCSEKPRGRLSWKVDLVDWSFGLVWSFGEVPLDLHKRISVLENRQIIGVR